MARRSIVPSDQTILVVDDQEEVLASVSKLLRREGHHVLTAQSAESALTLFKRHEVDLILVDYMMPRVSGADLVREIRMLDPFVQIILQTGYAGEQPPRATIAGLDIQGFHDKAEGPEKLLLWVDAGLKVNRTIKGLRRRLAGQAPAIKTANVLLVGGSSDLVAADTAGLEKEGHRVVAAAGDAEALAVFSRERPDIVVVEQPIETGADEFLRRMRVLDDSVPVIVRGHGLDAEQRRRLLHTFELHGIYDPDTDSGMLLELVASALNSIRRVRNVGAAQELRNLIVAKFCHELRNALHVIRGYSEILREDRATPSADDILDRLDLASESALGLAQDYLDLARLDAPGVVIRREPTDVDSLLADLRALSRRQIGARPVQFATDGVVRGSFVVTDAEKLRAILAQLLANAIKFTLSGEIRLSVRPASDHTDFVLTDGGPGIDQNVLPDVLSPAHQFRNDIAATAPGQGVGLAIALRLSALIGASLTAESDARGGAVFTLSLPVATSCRVDVYQPTLH